MDYDSLRKSDAFFVWHNYRPLDVQYLRYASCNPSVIAAGHKIDDVFLAFANARASFLFADANDFGEISSEDDFSKLYAKTHFLSYALIEYAICLDISWQVVWAYIQPASLEYLMKQRYKDMEKECDRESLLAQLQCAISQHGPGSYKAQTLMDIVKSFDCDDDVVRLRAIYNGIKHQGSIHFEGLGANFTSLSIGVNGKALPMLHRKSYSVEEVETLMFSYHQKFQVYMDKLIETIIPKDYLNGNIPFDEAFIQLMRMRNVMG